MILFRLEKQNLWQWVSFCFVDLAIVPEKCGLGEQTAFLYCSAKASMLHTFRSMDVYILAVGVGDCPLPRLFARYIIAGSTRIFRTFHIFLSSVMKNIEASFMFLARFLYLCKDS